MAAVGLADAFRYGTKYLGYLAVVLTVGVALVGAGAYLVALGGASLLGLSTATITIPQVAAGAILAVLGALVTVVGLIGMAFKFLADAAMVGVREAEAEDVAVFDVPETAESDAATGTAHEETPTTVEEASDESASTSDGAETDRAVAETESEPASDDGDEPPATDSDGPPTTDSTDERPVADEAESAHAGTTQAEAPDGPAEPTDGTAPEPDPTPNASETAEAAGSQTRIEPTEATAAETPEAEQSGAGPAETDPTAAETAAPETNGDAESVTSDPASADPNAGVSDPNTKAFDPTSDGETSAVGAAVAEAITFERKDDGDGSPETVTNSTLTDGVTDQSSTDDSPVTNRETRVEANGGPTGTEPDTEAGAPDTEAGAPDNVGGDASGEEWTPPDPEEFERETGQGGGSGGSTDGETDGTDANGTEPAERETRLDPSDATEPADRETQIQPSGSTDAPETSVDESDDEGETLADEGVSSIDVSSDDDPLADRLPGDDR